MIILTKLKYEVSPMGSQEINNKEAKVKIGIQYLKDLSIENPNSPHIFTVSSSQAPKMDINYNVSVIKLGQEKESNTSSFEVILEVTINSKIIDDKTKKEHTLFVYEVKYAGVFSIEDDDKEQEKRILFIYAPTILFPFVRQITSNATGSCGLPPLMLDPIDFAAQYEQQNSDNTS